MRAPDYLPMPPSAAQVAMLTAKHLRLLDRVDALANRIEVIDAYDAQFLKELRAIAAEARA